MEKLSVTKGLAVGIPENKLWYMLPICNLVLILYKVCIEAENGFYHGAGLKVSFDGFRLWLN